MRIAFDVRLLNVPGVGGARYAGSLLREMVAKSPQDEFCLIGGPGPQRFPRPVAANVRELVLEDATLCNERFEQLELPAELDPAIRARDYGLFLGRLDRRKGVVAELPDVAHTIAHTGCGEVAVERDMILRRLLGIALELVGPAIGAGVRVDRDDLDAGRGGRREDDRGATTEAADLDDPVAVVAA